jgi:hypothetical protein
MSTTDSKSIKKNTPGDGRDCEFGGRFKKTGGNNPFTEAIFTGNCQDLKDMQLQNMTKVTSS